MEISIINKGLLRNSLESDLRNSLDSKSPNFLGFLRFEVLIIKS